MMLKHRNRLATVARELRGRPDIKTLLQGKYPLSHIFSVPNDLSDKRLEMYRKAYFGIGDTECYKIKLRNDNQLFLKMEYTNAFGNTHYSRLWIIYLFIAEILGVIHPGETRIIEVTSGSSGIALSLACELLDYEVTILVPSILPESRVAPMQRKTTTIIRVNGYINECIQKLRELVSAEDYYATNHSEEKADIITFVFSRIAHEIVTDNINPDFAILAMGNGTSTLAISKTLKQQLPAVKVITYRPNYEEHPDDIVFGLIGANIECRHISLAMEWVDEMKFTTGIDPASVKEHYKFDTEIRNLGYSSLYGIYFAQKIAMSVSGKRILTLGYDKIDRY